MTSGKTEKKIGWLMERNFYSDKTEDNDGNNYKEIAAW